MSAGQAATDHIGVVVVASWYPSVLDPIVGRFVADQVRGIRDTGRVDVHVVSFEPINLAGEPADRASQVKAMAAVAASTRSDVELFRPRGWTSASGVPVARPVVPAGWVRDADEPARTADDRADALLGIADALRARLPQRALVHAHVAFPDGAAAARLAEHLGLPLVVTEHATFVPRILADPTQRAGYLSAVRAARRFVAVSEMFANELRTDIPELGDKLRVIPNVVATDDFALVEPSQRDPDELIFVGYRKETKGIDLLLDAFALVRAQRPSTRLRLVGRSPSRRVEQRWIQRAADLGLGDAVHFDGPADRAGTVDAMSRAALLVHAGYRETFGVVAVEALASGLPVIATDSGGINEILGDRADGLGALVHTREPADLSAAILDALEHRERFDPHVLRASVEERFGVRTVSEQVVALYDEVLAEDAATETGPAQARNAAPPPIPTPPQEPTVVVALDPARAAGTLRQLPGELLAHVWLVTVPAVKPKLPEGLAGVVRIDPEAAYRDALAAAGGTGRRGGPVARLRRLVRDPLGPVRRRRVRKQREEIMRTAPQRAIRRAARSAAGPRGSARVVPLDGPDVVEVQRVLGDTAVRVAPGGIRWLADAYAGADGTERT